MPYSGRDDYQLLREVKQLRKEVQALKTEVEILKAQSITQLPVPPITIEKPGIWTKGPYINRPTDT